MSLTAARVPLGKDPAGRLNFTPDPPTGSVPLWDPVPYRLRAFLAGECILDTTAAKLLHETGHLPVSYLPEEDLRQDLLEPSTRTSRCPHKGDASYRSLRVGDRLAEDVVRAYPEPLADSTRTRILVETSPPPRFYLPAEDVRTELLEPSPTTTRCAYKGEASYWHVRAGGELHEDLAWGYSEPDDAVEAIAGLICFSDEHVDVEVDGGST